MKKAYLLILALVGVQANVWAQVGLNNFSTAGRGGVANTFVHDYQALGINPANLGQSTDALSFSLFEGGAAFSSRALQRDAFSKFVEMADKQTVSLEDHQNLARAFTNSNVLNGGVGLNTLALSVYFPKVGGFAFSNRQRVLVHGGFNKNFAELMFLGKDAPVYNEVAPDEILFAADLFRDSEIRGTWVNEWNIGFGRELVNLPALKLYGGVGYKYLQGLALYEFSAKNGKLNAYRASAPFLDWEYDDFYLKNPDYEKPVSGSQFSPVGAGHGFDAGLSAEVAQKVKVAVSVTDLGSIRWTGNLMQGQDTGFKLPQDLEHAEDFSFADAAEAMQSVVDSTVTFSPLDGLTTKLPAKLRMGIGMQLNRQVEVGLDYVHALNDASGNIREDFVGVGVEVTPVPFFRFSTGISAGAGEKVNLPLGLAIVSPSYEFGISTRDVTAPFSSKNPGASFAMGFLRFKVGKHYTH